MGKLPNLLPHYVSPVTGEPCCSRAIKPTRKRGEMQPYIQQFKISRKDTALIRTGCIPCLHQGVKCDGTNPRCRKASITEAWRINSDMAWQGEGTWRERRGIHAFVNFILAPERTGLFESVFWHKTVMQACFGNDAVFHIATAIGALQEHMSQQSFNSNLNTSDGLSFALRQCNRAINRLLTSVNDSGRKDHDPGIPLIMCVLFAIFEALRGDSEQAIKHSLQGRKLLQHCETLASAGGGSRILNPMAVTPVVGGLEVQAKALQGKKMDLFDTMNIPAMPDVDRIHSLEHANWTLHYGYVSLLVFCQAVALNSPPELISSQMQQKRLLFAPWLQMWERSFASFLFREAKFLTLGDMQRAKVLKANHLASTMLANIDQGRGREEWANYNDECKAIIDLSASVLSTYSLGPNAMLSTFQFPFLTFGLWVAEPLFIVMSRAHKPELRRQAAGLLSGQPRPSRAQQIVMRKSFETPLEAPRVRKDTDGWDMEQWLEFCGKTRLDAGMATYFARLPSEYIDKPFYLPDSA